MSLESRLTKSLTEHSTSEEIAQIIKESDPTNRLGLLLNGAINEDLNNIISIMRIYFWNATPLSKQITSVLDISKDKLIDLYRKIQDIRLYQKVLSNHSMERRQISFAKELLEIANQTHLNRILHARNMIPLAVEFHPSPICNLRCKGCSSVDIENDKFLQYPTVAKPLDKDRITVLIDMFTDIGVKKFVFSGGCQGSC